MIRSFALNDDWDLEVKEVDGLKTIEIACDHRVNYQLVRSSLVSSKIGRKHENPRFLDWINILKNFDVYRSVLAARIALLLSSLPNVESFIFTNSQYNIVNNRLEITNICFLSSCETSKLECSVDV